MSTEDPVEAAQPPSAPARPRSPPVRLAGGLYLLQGISVLFGGGSAGGVISFAIGLALFFRRPGEPLYDLAKLAGTFWPLITSAIAVMLGLRMHEPWYAAGILAMSLALFLLVTERARTRGLRVGLVIVYLLGQALMLRAVLSTHSAPPSTPPAGPSVHQ